MPVRLAFMKYAAALEPEVMKPHTFTALEKCTHQPVYIRFKYIWEHNHNPLKHYFEPSNRKHFPIGLRRRYIVIL